jgi:hypothetical protein
MAKLSPTLSFRLCPSRSRWAKESTLDRLDGPLRCLQRDEVPDPGEERGLVIHEGLAEVVGPGRGITGSSSPEAITVGWGIWGSAGPAGSSGRGVLLSKVSIGVRSPCPADQPERPRRTACPAVSVGVIVLLMTPATRRAFSPAGSPRPAPTADNSAAATTTPLLAAGPGPASSWSWSPSPSAGSAPAPRPAPRRRSGRSHPRWSSSAAEPAHDHDAAAPAQGLAGVLSLVAPDDHEVGHAIKLAGPWPAHVSSWLVERLRLGVGHASSVRPDPSTLGVVGERGSRHEGRLPVRLR